MIGGRYIRLIDHPFLVSIRIENSHGCSGSIIHYNFIVTSANCVSIDIGVYYGNIKILHGTEDYYRPNYNPGIIHEVRYIIIHPEYIGHQNLWAHDIAILKVTTQRIK